MKTMWTAAAIGAAEGAQSAPKRYWQPAKGILIGFFKACPWLVLGFLARGVVPGEPVAYAQSGRVFELRTYTAPDGKLEELHKRFRDHTMRIFKNHGMTNVAYFRPQDAPLSQNTLIYLISHQSRDAAKANWAAFQADPEWQKVASESQKNGKIVAKVESVFLDPTDYSPLK